MRRLSINDPATKEDFERIYAELEELGGVVSSARKKDPEFKFAIARVKELEDWVSLAMDIEKFKRVGFRLVEDKNEGEA